MTGKYCTDRCEDSAGPSCHHSKSLFLWIGLNGCCHNTCFLTLSLCCSGNALWHALIKENLLAKVSYLRLSEPIPSHHPLL